MLNSFHSTYHNILDRRSLLSPPSSSFKLIRHRNSLSSSSIQGLLNNDDTDTLTRLNLGVNDDLNFDCLNAGTNNQWCAEQAVALTPSSEQQTSFATQVENNSNTQQQHQEVIYPPETRADDANQILLNISNYVEEQKTTSSWSDGGYSFLESLDLAYGRIDPFQQQQTFNINQQPYTFNSEITVDDSFLDRKQTNHLFNNNLFSRSRLPLFSEDPQDQHQQTLLSRTKSLPLNNHDTASTLLSFDDQPQLQDELIEDISTPIRSTTPDIYSKINIDGQEQPSYFSEVRRHSDSCNTVATIHTVSPSSTSFDAPTSSSLPIHYTPLIDKDSVNKNNQPNIQCVRIIRRHNTAQTPMQINKTVMNSNDDTTAKNVFSSTTDGKYRVVRVIRLKDIQRNPTVQTDTLNQQKSPSSTLTDQLLETVSIDNIKKATSQTQNIFVVKNVSNNSTTINSSKRDNSKKPQRSKYPPVHVNPAVNHVITKNNHHKMSEYKPTVDDKHNHKLYGSNIAIFGIEFTVCSNPNGIHDSALLVQKTTDSTQQQQHMLNNQQYRHSEKQEINSQPKIHDIHKLFSRIYRCVLCSAEFDEYEQFVLHGSGHLNDLSLMPTPTTETSSVFRRRSYCCLLPNCHERIESPTESPRILDQLFRRHLLSHVGTHPFKCQVCKSKFQRIQNYRAHLLSHNETNSQLLQCKNCSKKFTTFKQYNFHVRKCFISPYTTPIYKCYTCGENFEKEDSLTLHMKHMHSQERRKQQQVTTVATTTPIMDNEMRNTKELQMCGISSTISPDDVTTKNVKEFISPSQSISAVTTPVSGKARHHVYSCQSCDKVFNRRLSYKKHLLIHVGDKHYSCTYPGCKRLFYTQPNLNRHIRTVHLRVRTYTCTFPNCGKTFTRNDTLKNHRSKHFPNMIMKCPYVDCDEKFRIRSTYHAHLKRHRTDGNKRQNGNLNNTVSYVCTIQNCSFTTGNKSSLKQHLTKAHKYVQQKDEDIPYVQIQRHSLEPNFVDNNTINNLAQVTTSASLVSDQHSQIQTIKAPPLNPIVVNNDQAQQPHFEVLRYSSPTPIPSTSTLTTEKVTISPPLAPVIAPIQISDHLLKMMMRDIDPNNLDWLNIENEDNIRPRKRQNIITISRDMESLSTVVVENLCGCARTDYRSNHAALERAKFRRKLLTYKRALLQVDIRTPPSTDNEEEVDEDEDIMGSHQLESSPKRMKRWVDVNDSIIV
ncbi:unnamed protein product [Didymodactylos carnosus]|uniref:C2H2-type domain-containing protein n=1 Tax=Didymodactylos carnosus TaxID=1234261 RepID=A0A813ZM63_9BILA|nr:unnamed protein product [Didymodactylos carnosus]CAF1134668.1 unnamed protein product [Didymodactylos carnosus]CAF3682552.1 unnamed protein product [Didymodactylos carnosus]CAF3921896.1 unnamed protein product [Didymodactylos carnosus]